MKRIENNYEAAAAVVGKTIKSADFGGGKYSSITFTDGSRLEFEAQPEGRDGWGYHLSESMEVTLKIPENPSEADR